MKAIKKIMTCVLAAAMTFGSSTAVFAAGSIQSAKPSVVVDPSHTDQYEVKDVTEGAQWQEIVSDTPEVAEAIENTNADPNADTLVSNLENSDSESAKEVAAEIKDKNMDMLTPFFDVDKSGDDVAMVDGKYSVTLSLPSLTDDVQSVQILHYSPVRKLWELVNATIDRANKTINGLFEDLSPMSILAVIVNSPAANNAAADTTAVTTGTTASAANTTAAAGTTGAASATTTTAVSNAAVTSPQTGVSTNYGAWIVAAIVLLGSAVVVSRKKRA